VPSTKADSSAAQVLDANDARRVAAFFDAKENDMDLLMKQGSQLGPKDHAEAIGIFRAQVIGPLLTRAFSSHGELAEAIRIIARQTHRPPHASTSRTYSPATLERWYYRFKRHGLVGVTPRRRS
jgi:hypothetical protein